jgi:excinuclease ABC subunit A
LFDEPTTGLHFADVEKLVAALQRLIADGHSVVVIEHNLDVIGAADWVVDLGPEGGGAGGRVVATGTPASIRRTAASHTGRALLDYDRNLERVDGVRSHSGVRSHFRDAAKEARDLKEMGSDPAFAFAFTPRRNEIEIVHAREHNLRNVDLKIPRDKLTVITGVSGSGKSTVAFDILFAEGQRRYLESLNAYARQFVEPAGRADVDAVYGIPPTVAIEQRTSRGGRKSTVATLTEIYHFLRLLFVKLGVQYCPDCDVAIDAQSSDAIRAKLMTRHRGKRVALLSPLVIGRKGYYTELADWAAGRGYSTLRVDGVEMPTDQWPRLDRFKEHNIELAVAQIEVTAAADRELDHALQQALRLGRNMAAVSAATAPASCIPPSARVRAVRAASSRSIRGCSRTTRATVGVRSASAPASSLRASMSSRRAKRRGGSKPKRRPKVARGVRGSGCGPRRTQCAFARAASVSLRRCRCSKRSPTSSA